LPYFSKGNLQDVINENAVTGRRIDERRLLELFHGTCLA
jgi:serine/threonine kinase 16